MIVHIIADARCNCKCCDNIFEYSMRNCKLHEKVLEIIAVKFVNRLTKGAKRFLPSAKPSSSKRQVHIYFSSCEISLFDNNRFSLLCISDLCHRFLRAQIAIQTKKDLNRVLWRNIFKCRGTINSSSQFSYFCNFFYCLQMRTRNWWIKISNH